MGRRKSVFHNQKRWQVKAGHLSSHQEIKRSVYGQYKVNRNVHLTDLVV